MKIIRSVMVLVFILLFSCKVLSNKKILKSRTFIANIGSICEETPEPNPCAGQEIYLVLEFEEKEVLIFEKYISSCDKESIIDIGNYKWKLIDNSEVKIYFNSEKQQDSDIKKMIFELDGKQLLGKIKNSNNSITEHVFIEVWT